MCEGVQEKRCLMSSKVKFRQSRALLNPNNLAVEDTMPLDLICLIGQYAASQATIGFVHFVRKLLLHKHMIHLLAA